MKVCGTTQRVYFTRKNSHSTMTERSDYNYWFSQYVELYRKETPGKVMGNILFSDELTFFT